ncbi:MAG TPA: IS66 family transposase [Deltaproteobacteria bacterium]|nr:IS66 family transposase [Deltaproteobacteria bacterium]|tara:strand:+ start:1317 stop:2990 length:1674 start_codon:yes stop_codon:yes gene_type:complete
MPDLPPEWKSTFDRLERDAEAANRRADRLQASVDRLADLLAKQGDELTAISKMLRRREDQLTKAERENRRLRKKLGLDDPDPEPDAAPIPDEQRADDGGSDEPPPSGSSGDSRALAGDAPDETDETDETTAGTRKPRRGGRRRPPVHLPADEERHTVCACSRCGGSVTKRDVLKTEVYTAVQSYVRRRVIERERVVCATCDEPTTAPMPPMPCDRALYDCAFIAWVVTMKFAYLMPLDRIQAMLASQGVHLAMGTLVHLIERATALADAVDGEHMKQLKAGRYICFDGTGLKVLIPGQRSAWDGYLEVYTREELTVFQFDLTKHADELRERLALVKAVLVTDAESRNKAGAPGATFAHCNAHVVRKLREAVHVQPELAREGLDFLDDLYDIEEEASRFGLTGDKLRSYRQNGRPILERFKTWLHRVAEADLPPSDPVGKVARYYLRHWEGLTRFVDDPDLPIDNNEAEREFQRHAKLRLASLFAGSIEGAHRWATLLGVVRTAQKHDLDVQAYLMWMFERRGTHRARFDMPAKELTPAAYKAAGCPGSLTESVALAA